MIRHSPSLQWLRIAAATRAGADLLVTYDKGMLSKSIVPTVTPKDAIAWLEAL